MATLVTGAAGLIGSNLCKKLLKDGYEVVALDNLITGSPENIKKLKLFPKFTFIQHDITKPLPNNFELLTLNFELIYHLACPTGVPNLGPLAEEMLLTCSLGTRQILELAKRNKAKLLFTSSSEVYGDPEVFPQYESYSGNVDPTGPRSPYEEGKRFAESLIMMYVRKYELDAKIVRIFNTYGPGMGTEESRVIARFLQQAVTGEPLSVHGQGLQKRTFCFVDDLVNGLILVMKKGKRGEVYNLGSNQEISIIELAKLIIKLTNSKSKINWIERPSHDHQARLPALKKVRKLGWRMKISLKDGLLKTIDDYSQKAYNSYHGRQYS